LATWSNAPGGFLFGKASARNRNLLPIAFLPDAERMMARIGEGMRGVFLQTIRTPLLRDWHASLCSSAPAAPINRAAKLCHVYGKAPDQGDKQVYCCVKARTDFGLA
jgi:hypothetical protein